MFKYLLSVIELISIAILPFVTVSAQHQSQLQLDLIKTFQSGDVTPLEKWLSTSTWVKPWDGNKNQFSKQQTIMLLKEFFKKYPPASFKIIHSGSAEGEQFYWICKFEDQQQHRFRIYVLARKIKDGPSTSSLKIVELRITYTD